MGIICIKPNRYLADITWNIRDFYEKYLPDNTFKILEFIENGNYFEYLAQELYRLPGSVKDYTEGAVWFGLLDRIAQHWLLRSLERLSINYHGSKDLLNFVFHFHALNEG